jgi:hypothetical protein
MHAKNYKNKHGWCGTHIDDRHECVNFKLVAKTRNCCKHMLITGECDFVEKVNYSRRGMCLAQTVTQEAECRNHEPAKGGRYTQVCRRRTEEGKCHHEENN